VTENLINRINPPLLPLGEADQKKKILTLRIPAPPLACGEALSLKKKDSLHFNSPIDITTIHDQPFCQKIIFFLEEAVSQTLS
jgi:hypothetical protein